MGAGVVYKNPQLARRLCPVLPDPVCANKGDIVEYGIKQVVKKVGDGEEDFVIEEKVVEVSRVNRQLWIAKDADDVGVMNILEKVRRSGDVTLFNQTHDLITDDLQDYTDVPGSVGEALKSISKGADSFAGLKAIFGDISFDELANMSETQIAEKLAAFVASKTPQKEEGEEK